MASSSSEGLKMILQPLVDDTIDEEIILYISEAALESPEDIADTIKGLLPQLEQYSETTLNSVVASLLHELQGTSKKDDAKPQKPPAKQHVEHDSIAAAAASSTGHAGAAAALAASKARTGAAPAPSSEPGWSSAARVDRAPRTSKSAAAAPHTAVRELDMESASPQLQAVASMFPDIPPALLLRLLTKSAHNVEAAVDTLLAQEDLSAFVAQLQQAEQRAAVKAAAAAQSRSRATAAAKARVLQRFDEHDIKSSVAAPDIIKVDGKYVQIRAQRGAPASSKKMLKQARQVASRKAASMASS